MSSPLTAPLPPYNPLALSLKKTPISLLSSPSSPSTILDFSSSVKREGRGSTGIDMSLDGALRLGRGSEGSTRSGSSGGLGYWREQWWSNMPTDHRRVLSTQTGEDHHSQEDSKEVNGGENRRVSVFVAACPSVLDACLILPLLGFFQGILNDSQSRHKPWNKLNQKTRDPYLRMQSWLNGDQGQNAHIQQAQNQGKEPTCAYQYIAYGFKQPGSLG